MPRRVLIIRVQHHDDVGTPSKRGGIRGLLIAAVSSIAFVPDRLEPKFAGEPKCVVFTRVISQCDLIDDIRRDLSDGLTQRLLGVVSRQSTTTFFPESII